MHSLTVVCCKQRRGEAERKKLNIRRHFRPKYRVVAMNKAKEIRMDNASCIVLKKEANKRSFLLLKTLFIYFIERAFLASQTKDLET